MTEDSAENYTVLQKFFNEFALFEAIEQKNHKRFKSLISQPDFDVDHVDRNGRSLLMQLATIPHGYIFVQQLLHRGANVHLKDNHGSSFLHLAVRARNVNNVKMGELLIQNGADVDCVDNSGLTPMYVACLEGNVRWIHMLLYYGADPNIASKAGLLPMAVLSLKLRSGDDYDFLLEVFFCYAFDFEEARVRLPTLAAAMWRESSLFSKICEISPRIVYHPEDIEYFCSYLCDVKSKHFSRFLEEFGYVLEDIIDSVDFLSVVIESMSSMDFPENWNILNSLLNSRYLCKLMQNTNPCNPVISQILQQFSSSVPNQKLLSAVFLMLSYGLHVTLQDLQTVFDHFGQGNLFRILLHLDVAPIHEEGISSIVKLCHDPKLTLEDCWNDHTLSTVLGFFSSPRLKELCLLTVSDEDLVDKVKQMPSVCSLAELSRNVVRRYIVQKYEIGSCREFHLVLNGLPIDRVTRSIIALERKIY